MAAQTHSFFPATMKIDAIDRKIAIIEAEIVNRKVHGLGSAAALELWKSIAKDYRAAQVRQQQKESPP